MPIKISQLPPSDTDLGGEGITTETWLETAIRDELGVPVASRKTTVQEVLDLVQKYNEGDNVSFTVEEDGSITISAETGSFNLEVCGLGSGEADWFPFETQEFIGLSVAEEETLVLGPDGVLTNSGSVENQWNIYNGLPEPITLRVTISSYSTQTDFGVSGDGKFILDTDETQITENEVGDVFTFVIPPDESLIYAPAFGSEWTVDEIYEFLIEILQEGPGEEACEPNIGKLVFRNNLTTSFPEAGTAVVDSGAGGGNGGGLEYWREGITESESGQIAAFLTPDAGQDESTTMNSFIIGDSDENSISRNSEPVLRSFILGGTNNNINEALDAAIINSSSITLEGVRSTVIGARSSSMDDWGSESIIVGGSGHSVIHERSSITGGENNLITAPHSSIVGGQGNRVGMATRSGSTTTFSGIFCGTANTIDSGVRYSVIIGGDSNNIGEDYTNPSFSAPSYYSSIIGGEENKIGSNSYWSTIIGGRENTIQNGNQYSTILGGSAGKSGNFPGAVVIPGTGSTNPSVDVRSQCRDLVWTTVRSNGDGFPLPVMDYPVGTVAVIRGEVSVRTQGDDFKTWDVYITYVRNDSVHYIHPSSSINPVASVGVTAAQGDVDGWNLDVEVATDFGSTGPRLVLADLVGVDIGNAARVVMTLRAHENSLGVSIDSPDPEAD